MIVPVMAISNWVLTQQIYSEETIGVHAHNRDRVPLTQSKYAFVSSNDNRNLRKYIIDFIVKITNAFSNRVTSEQSTTLLKFIYIVWARAKRFFVTTTWNNETKTKSKSPGD